MTSLGKVVHIQNEIVQLSVILLDIKGEMREKSFGIEMYPAGEIGVKLVKTHDVPTALKIFLRLVFTYIRSRWD
ncbi:MAG: hypothetical protein DWQ02_26240 [Bacteroidetes bacterium]|nr:MAG: hypothetical protein DWQ02_26240 [Bacteroidota bacterium]